MKKLTLIIITVLLSLNFNLFSQDVKYDPNQMWVTDLDDVFTPEQEKELNQIISDYEQKTTCDIAILTTNDYEDSGDILNYAFEVGEKWGVGKKDIDNGLMIIISKTNDENAVVTGYGLEGYLTDAWTYHMQDSLFVTYFIEGKYFEGTKLFLSSCFEQIGEEYSADENESKREDDSLLSIIWAWILSLPLWLKIVVIGLYILWCILDPGSAYWFTIFLFTLGSGGRSGSMGGGSFGGGGSRS